MKKTIFFIGLVLWLFCNATQAQNVTQYSDYAPYRLKCYFEKMLPQKDTLYVVLVFPKKTQNTENEIRDFLKEIKRLSPESETVVVASSLMGGKRTEKYLNKNKFPCDYTISDASDRLTRLLDFNPKKLKERFYVMKIDLKKGRLLKSEYVEGNVNEIAANFKTVSTPDVNNVYMDGIRYRGVININDYFIGITMLSVILLAL